MKNSLIKLLYHLFKPHKINHFNSSAPRILIVSTTALGDTLWSTPIIYDIRKTYKEAYISSLTGPLGYESLKNNPFLDKVYLLQKPLSLLRELQKERFEAILIFHTSQRIALALASLLGAEKIVGSFGKNKGLDFLLTHAVKDLPNMHEIERRQNIAREIGTKIETTKIFFYPDLYPKNLKSWHFSLRESSRGCDDRKRGNINEYCPFSDRTTPGLWRGRNANFSGSLGIERSAKNLVALHPGASSYFKTWPKENFVLLAKALKAKGFKVAFTGSLKEKEFVLSFSSQVEGSMALYNLSISQLAVFLKEASLFITADTGPLHLASAMGTKTIALFSPTSPSSSGSLSPNTYTFYYPPSCDTCLKKRCSNNICMQKILVEEVLNKALELLS